MTIYKETGLHRHPEGKERDMKAISRASNRPTVLAPLLPPFPKANDTS